MSTTLSNKHFSSFHHRFLHLCCNALFAPLYCCTINYCYSVMYKPLNSVPWICNHLELYLVTTYCTFVLHLECLKINQYLIFIFDKKNNNSFLVTKCDTYNFKFCYLHPGIQTAVVHGWWWCKLEHVTGHSVTHSVGSRFEAASQSGTIFDGGVRIISSGVALWQAQCPWAHSLQGEIHSNISINNEMRIFLSALKRSGR